MKTPVIVAFGGGTNSAAMLIEMQRRQVIPDLILFADTGGELPETYEFVKVFSRWLQDKGMPKIELVKYKRETLEENCIRSKMLPSLAYGFKSCSQKFKIQPQPPTAPITLASNSKSSTNKSSKLLILYASFHNFFRHKQTRISLKPTK